MGSVAANDLYNQLFNPAVNIQTGSAYVEIQVSRYHHGNLLQGLNAYGTGAGYGEDVLNCVKQLQQGNATGAFGAAIGK